MHTAYNPSDSDETVVIATILGVDAGAPPSIHADATAAAALNDRCGTDAPIPPS